MIPPTDKRSESFWRTLVFSFKKRRAKIKVKTGVVARRMPASEDEALSRPKV